MRLTTVILLASLLQVSAATFGQRITLDQRNAPIESVLKEIRRQSGFSFVYDVNTLKQVQKVSVTLKNAELEDALKSLLIHIGLSYQIDGKIVSIKKEKPSILSNLIDVIDDIEARGKVVDKSGQPIAGVIVRVKGTNRMVRTNDLGIFTIKYVEKGEVLIFSYLGYAEREIPAKETMGNIQIEESVSQLQNVDISVVNTGYQTLSLERSAGAFSKPDMQVLSDRTTSMNVLDRLDGQVPGLVMNNTPNSVARFTLRGMSTINSSQDMLIVVDGVVTANSIISSINPQDVEDITVLKDATAASIWGARASNGVIVITTKKGVEGEKLKINYNGFTNFQGKPQLDYFPTMNSAEFIQTIEEIYPDLPAGQKDFFTLYPYANVSAGVGAFLPAPHEQILYDKFRGLISPSVYRQRLDSLAGMDNRQQINDLLYRSSLLTNHTLSLSGGSKAHTFYGSLGYTNNRSVVPGEKNNSYKANVRQDFKISKRIQAHLITDLTYSLTGSDRPVNSDYRFLPYQLFRDENGNNINFNFNSNLGPVLRADRQARSRINLDYVPLDEVNRGWTKGEQFQSRITGGTKINLLKGLNFEGVYGFYRGNSRSQLYDHNTAFNVRRQTVQFTVAPTTTSTPIYNLPRTGGNYQTNTSVQKRWTVRNQLSFDKDWLNREHQLTILLGQEAQAENVVNNASKVYGYDLDLQSFVPVDYNTFGSSGPGLQNPVWPSGGSRSTLNNDVFNENEAAPIRFSSYFANFGYTFKRKYTINGSWRNDKSNLFGKDKAAQNKPVWSVGGKWILNEENFLKNVSWLDRLALRGTYGITGNSPTAGAASSYDLLRSEPARLFVDGVSLDISTPGNPGLSWEVTKTTNFGLDFTVFRGRISGSVDLYKRFTTELLGDKIANPFTGFATITGNFGDMRNRGIELGLQSLNVESGKFAWRSSLNLSYNKNTITRIISTPITTGSAAISRSFAEGFPAYAVFAYTYAGLDQLGDPRIQKADGTVVKRTAEAKPEDVKLMGVRVPKVAGGFGNSFYYGGFSLSANAIFNLGHVFRNSIAPTQLFSRLRSTESTTGGNIDRMFLERWKKPGDEDFTKIPAYLVNAADNQRRDVLFYSSADINVHDASYVKLRDVTFSYTLPKSLLSKIRLQSLSFRAQVSNILLWTANDLGIDPEFYTGFERTLPVGQHAVTLGANLTF